MERPEAGHRARGPVSCNGGGLLAQGPLTKSLTCAWNMQALVSRGFADERAIRNQTPAS